MYSKKVWRVNALSMGFLEKKVKIKVEADKNNNSIEYRIVFPLSGDTQVSKIMTENEMKSLLDDISTVLGFKPIMEKFNCTIEDARDIKKVIDRSDCQKCDLRMKECYRCCIVCESPLEKDLLLALVRNEISVELQMRINKDGSTGHFPEDVNPSKILTIPDFYVETDNKKICIYTDGHTYHERTEYQAVRDRSIDRDLQNLGYIVLRYTSSEIRQKLEDVIRDIKRTMGIEDVHGELTFKNDEFPKEGSCIRCGNRMAFNLNRPLCDDCYQTWVQFENIDYIERFCHKCGNEYENSISFRQPLCKRCSC